MLGTRRRRGYRKGGSLMEVQQNEDSINGIITPTDARRMKNCSVNIHIAIFNNQTAGGFGVLGNI